MAKQFSLFETPRPSLPKYNVFLAIFPDDRTARTIIELGSTLRQTLGMHGRLRPVSHLHVSLLFLGGTMVVPEKIVEVIGRVCQTVAAVTSPFEIKFDQVLSFRGRPGNHPLVLVGDDQVNTGARNLLGCLNAEFAKHFPWPASAPQFVPHLTLLYDKQELAPRPVGPVGWTATEMVLVRSEVGATQYDWLGRWAFGG